MRSGRWGPYRQASPHRPGTDPAHGLRAERAVVFLPQTTSAKETTMWFRTRTPRRPMSTGQRPARLSIEALEDRSLPSGGVTLAVNDDSILVGERVTWTATATDVGATPVYQFRAAPHGGAFHVVRDFSPANAFTWTPMQEGTYDIEVAVKDGYQATETTTAIAVDAVTS